MTICTKDRIEYFGERGDGKMGLNKLGKIVADVWEEIPTRFKHVSLDEFVVMPNHVHGIIVINPVGAGLASAPSGDAPTVVVTLGGAEASPAPTLGDIICAFKSYSFLKWRRYAQQNDLIDMTLKFWQRNYYEHVIRNDIELEKIREYIYQNPNNWDLDENNPLHFKKS